MANTQGFPTYDNFRIAMLTGLYPTSGIYAALFLSSATVGPTTTAYSPTGEASGTGYDAGGVEIDSSTPPSIDGSTVHWTPAEDIEFGPMSVGPVNAVMLYDSNESDRNLGVWLFGEQTVVSGVITLGVPADTGATGLVRLAFT